jgi:hypothetical protein
MMISFTSVAILLVGHWTGDYLFQTNKMAEQKSDSLRWLTLHVIAYSTALALFSFFLLPLQLWIGFVMLNGVVHFVQDFFTSKLAAGCKSNPRFFYPVVGFDQLLHTLTLTGTMNLLIGIVN